jgi:KDO2-lipid IV(A) lauroyltransferase
MAASIDKLIYGSAGLRAVVALARAVPPRLGHAAADTISGWIASRGNSHFVQAARENQRIVAGKGPSSEVPEATLRAVFHNAGRAQYDLYHYLENPAAVERIYLFDEACRVFLDRREYEKRGLILAALHTPGFDLGLRWLCRDKLKFRPIVLTIPDPEGGRQLEFEARQEAGMELLPGSAMGLRRALRYLQRGGFVLTGIDHPVRDAAPRPLFFGRRAALPMHHVYLAIKARVPIVVEFSSLGDDGKYHVSASPLIEMEPRRDRQEELLLNAEKVLSVVEGFIRREPEQWLMFQPVWPDAERGNAG